jgi:hypothetical protein
MRRSVVGALFLVVAIANIAWAGIPNTVGWHALPDTRIDQHGCQWTSGSNGGASGCAAITSAWNGALFDSTRNRMILLGNGGHNDYYGNEVISLNIGTSNAVTDTQTLTRIKDSSPSPQSFGGSCTLSDGAPRSFHTYSNVAYIPDFDRYISLGGARSPDGFMQNCVYYLQWPGLTWTFLANSPIDRSGGHWGSGAAWDGERHVLWAADQFQLYYFTPTSGGGTWVTPTQTGFTGTGAQGDMIGVSDPVRDRFYLIGNGAIWYWNVSNPANVGARQTPSVSGCGTTLNGAPGADYDSAQDRIVIWNGGNTLALFNPATNACTTVTYSGGPAAVSNGTYGRFKYSAKDNLFVTCQSVSINCYAIRLTVQNADTDYARRCNAPGVVRCQGFDNAADYTIRTSGVGAYAGDGGFDGTDCDTSIKTSGPCALRFTLPAGRATSDIAGSWLDCTRSTCGVGLASGFTQGQTFYISYRERASATMVSNLASWQQTSGGTGWKSLIVHGTDSSGQPRTCDNIEITTTTWLDSGTGTQIWYTECGNRGAYANNAGAQSNAGPWIQQGSPALPASVTSGFRCDFNNQVIGTGNGIGCWRWQWANEWIAYLWKVTIVDFTTNSGTIQTWIARDGGTTWLPVINMVGNFRFQVGSFGASNATFNRVTFTPYMTNLSVAASQDANLWFDEFIVSTEPIDLPGVVGSGADTTPPAPPTNIRVSQLGQ